MPRNEHLARIELIDPAIHDRDWTANLVSGRRTTRRIISPILSLMNATAAPGVNGALFSAITRMPFR